MKVQSISTNYQPRFGDTYTSGYENFSNKQKLIVDRTLRTLRTPSDALNNKTPEQYYKEKGIDFYIAGYDNDTVYLEGRTGMKKIGSGVDEAATYDDCFKIGVYDEQYPLKIKDIETGLKDKNFTAKAFAIPVAGVIIGVFLMIAQNISNSKDAVKDAAKPLIENIDSVAKKAQEILPDTIKTLKSIK